jgi:hypothetical protein
VTVSESGGRTHAVAAGRQDRRKPSSTPGSPARQAASAAELREVAPPPPLGLDAVPARPAVLPPQALPPLTAPRAMPTVASRHGSVDVPPAMRGVLRKTGQPLESGLLTDLQVAFGQASSAVRVLTGDSAAASAASLASHAHTVGRHIVFGPGEDRCPGERQEQCPRPPGCGPAPSLEFVAFQAGADGGCGLAVAWSWHGKREHHRQHRGVGDHVAEQRSGPAKITLLHGQAHCPELTEVVGALDRATVGKRVKGAAVLRRSGQAECP